MIIQHRSLVDAQVLFRLASKEQALLERLGEEGLLHSQAGSKAVGLAARLRSIFPSPSTPS